MVDYWCMIFKEKTDLVPPHLNSVRLDMVTLPLPLLCPCPCMSAVQPRYTPQNTCLYTNTKLALPTLNTNTAWLWYHNKSSVLGIRAALFFFLRPLSRSKGMALCPVTYITLAGCHTKNTVSRLMAGLRFTGNISHILTVKTMVEYETHFQSQWEMHFQSQWERGNMKHGLCCNF